MNLSSGDQADAQIRDVGSGILPVIAPQLLESQNLCERQGRSCWSPSLSFSKELIRNGHALQLILSRNTVNMNAPNVACTVPPPIAESPLVSAPVSTTDPTKNIFWCLTAFHLLIWTVVPAITQPNAPLDAIEMLYWGHEWQWGYYKHPPLAAWVAELFTFLTPGSVWPTYVASQLCVVGCFLAVWIMARQTLRPWPALTSVFLLEACYYYNFTTPELNNNTLAKVTWAWSVLVLYRAITKRGWLDWVAAGLCLGLALLSKYDAALLIVVLLGFSWLHPQARRCWRSRGPYLTVLAALVVFVPHLWWMVENDYPTIHYLFERSENSHGWFGRLVNPVGFAVSQLIAVGVLPLLAQRLFHPRWRLCAADARQTLQRQYLATVLFGPFVLVLLLSLVTGAHMRSMWGSALWTYLGVFLLLTFQADQSWEAHRPILRSCVVLMIVLAVAFGVRNLLSPYLRSKPSRVHFPGRLLAEAVEERWLYRQHTSRLPLVAGDWWAAGNVGFFYPGRISVYADASHKKSPWVDDSQLAASGGVILGGQDTDDKTFDDWLVRFPQAEELEPISLPWQTGANLPPTVFRVAVIDPADAATVQETPMRSANLDPETARRKVR